ncbi:hypothetical protein TCAL_00713 [Tigriopus californicus]|uniref:Uncharacterized protein n=1 Tax=Tigriopus californicus TaxID=6832 RepID=A0A553PAF1_TIGCA|nr:ectonucleoside triphosphate diphosphohydrolase 1-like [Tigriopus californicus]TRY74660.1 hypothetical protein TCAL_00713 [Tigriopus californicus]|eukprot:TCALIF_00713-PA protein Name:"Similar to ENTPD1 Ectonucleoside triphosphate diphosphohydrolase 1 (Sus scrofa)" AED:0.09 eAED:0.09 QI:0/-1/0/1/-1/1/1/0/631
MSANDAPQVEAPSQERERLVRPNRVPIKIISTLSTHKGSEVFQVHREQRVGNVLLAYLQGKNFPEGNAYCLRDEDGLLLWNSYPIGDLVSSNDPIVLYVCMAPNGEKNIPRMCLYVIVVWALMLFTFIFFLNIFAPSILSRSSTDPAPLHAASIANRYEVVVDAGSVHTDVSLYEWGAKINDTGVVQEIFSCETAAGQGVSSFVQKPEAVQDYLLNSSCLLDAISRVPEDQKGSTDIFLGTTAGMRILNATNPIAAQQIIGNISLALNKTKLHYTKPNALILSGDAEGVMGWISSNYLSHKFAVSPNASDSDISDQEPMGALDWGGASAQITFIPRDSSQGNRVVNLFKKQYNVFTKSNLCYGQAEGLKRYLVGLIFKQYQTNGRIEFNLQSPCHPKGKKTYKTDAKALLESPCARYKDGEFQKMLDGVSGNSTFTFIGQSDPARCKQEIRPQFHLSRCRSTYEQGHCLNSSSIPKPQDDAKFLAFSTYWYLLHALQENHTQVGEAHFEGMSEKLCSSSYGFTSFMSKYGADYRHNSCFKSVFMDLLLSEGYKKDDWVNISFVKRVSDAEVGWTLGYMLQKTNQIPDRVLYVMEQRTVFLITLFATSFYAAIIYMLWYICTYSGNDKMVQR